MDKIDVFISHITEEKKTAIYLKEFLRESLGWGLQVFVSSDYESIGGGDIWFNRIVDALKSSPVEIVLLSPDSVSRQWINFEAGVGIGAGALVVPVVVHGLERSEVGHPLSSIQIRSVVDADNVRALIKDVEKRLNITARTNHMDRFLTEINQNCAHRVSTWSGAEWQGVFLAVDGPVMKLAERSNQAYQESMSTVLKEAGFTPRLSGTHNLGPTLGAGYKIVYMTDRKTYRAEIHQYDVMLTAKQD